MIRWLAHPRRFLSGVHLGAIAVTTQRMLATTVGPAPAKLVSIDERGTVHPFVPEFVAPADAVCHLALSPGLRDGFPDGEVFVSVGVELWRLRSDANARDLVLTIAPAYGEIAGLCFDTSAEFRNDLLLLTQSGVVFRIGPDFLPTPIGSVAPGGQGPSVLSTANGARLMVAFPATSAVRAMAPNGSVTTVSGWSGVSAALAFPRRPSAYAGTGAALFVATSDGEVAMFALADVGPRAGSLLLTSLYASGSGLATPRGTRYELDAWSPHRGPEVAAAFVQRPAVLHVDVDVAPDILGGPLPLNDPTPVRVAVLGSSSFATTWVDAASVRCAGAAPVANVKTESFTFADVNADGEVDLVTSFRPSEMEIDVSTRRVTLSGHTLAGDAFRGQAAVRVIVPPNRPRVRSRREIPVTVP